MNEQKKINVRNKRATFDYEILEEYTAGIVLAGTEIKSIRAPSMPGARATTTRRAATGSCCSRRANWRSCGALRRTAD